MQPEANIPLTNVSKSTDLPFHLLLQEKVQPALQLELPAAAAAAAAAATAAVVVAVVSEWR